MLKALFIATGLGAACLLPALPAAAASLGQRLAAATLVHELAPADRPVAERGDVARRRRHPILGIIVHPGHPIRGIRPIRR